MSAHARPGADPAMVMHAVEAVRTLLVGLEGPGVDDAEYPHATGPVPPRPASAHPAAPTPLPVAAPRPPLVNDLAPPRPADVEPRRIAVPR